MTLSMVVTASVRLGAGSGTALADGAADSLIRAVVDTNLHLPGMFELTFVDDGSGALSQAGLVMGATV